MNILLVNPPRFDSVSVIREERCEITERYSVLPPYSLLQVASLLRLSGNKIQLIDANGWNLSWEEINEKIKNAHYDAIVFRFTPTTFDLDNKVASISKKNHPKAWTIGICWTLHTVPKEVLQSSVDLDIYIRHEYETVTPAVVVAISRGDDLSSVRGIAYQTDGKIEVNADAEPLPDWDFLPLPAYDLLPSLKSYFINTPHGSPFTILYTSKGCPYSCIFCTVRNTPVKKRSAESIVSELRYLKKNFNIKMVSFFDETFTLDKARVLALCEALKSEDLKIVWYCNTRVGLVDADLLKKMYAAGCRGLSYGVESGSQEILNNAMKGATVGQAENAIKWARKAGLKVLCSFILGLPGENWNTVKETIDFVKRTMPTGAQFNVAVPYPGSELHRVAMEKGWIKPGVDWKSMYQHDAVMRTDELSFEDLDQARKMAYRSLYSNPKWWLQNMWHTARHLEDFSLATRYGFKVVKNFTLNKMAHAH
jgi:anaerobic magnesium-protoporphyrin IX monomethyl ester cyclase